jgi:hypothetical protein
MDCVLTKCYILSGDRIHIYLQFMVGKDKIQAKEEMEVLACYR